METLRESNNDLNAIVKELEIKWITITVKEQSADWIAEIFATKCNNWGNRCASCSSCQKCSKLSSDEEVKLAA